MRKAGILLLVAMLALSCNSSKNGVSRNAKNVLVFTKTNGFRHASIETGVNTLRELGAANNWVIQHSEDSLIFSPENLKNLDLIVFLNTTGDILGSEQEEAFKNYMEGGGSFFGIHAASDTEYDWPWYGDFIGGYFISHPQTQQATVVKNHKHTTVAMFPEQFQRTDEWYNFKNLSKNVHVTLSLDETSYEGGENGDYHPHAWYHKVGEGRMYYTGGGHTTEAYSEPMFKEHLQEVIKWLMDSSYKF